MGSLPKNIQLTLQGSILGRTFLLLYIHDVPDGICNIAIYADETAFYS